MRKISRARRARKDNRLNVKIKGLVAAFNKLRFDAPTKLSTRNLRFT